MVLRVTFAPAIRARYIRSFHGTFPSGLGPITGFEFRPPVRWRPVTASAFRKEHRLLGLFSFGVERIDFDLAKDWGGWPHIVETGYKVTFPLWFPAILFGLFPVILFFRRRRGKMRSSVGFCAMCGYDLRATPDRCPECGTIPPKKEITSN
ncbi:MAG: hypothetical protein ABSB42_16885 [Tepidisphaeraceae bacterium]|jgi:hypothetical protein